MPTGVKHAGSGAHGLGSDAVQENGGSADQSILGLPTRLKAIALRPFSVPNRSFRQLRFCVVPGLRAGGQTFDFNALRQQSSPRECNRANKFHFLRFTDKRFGKGSSHCQG
jgi:hypothetical protein